MKIMRLPFAAAVLASVLLSAAPAFAGGKEYQVTGPVISVTDAAIVVKKGAENWEIARAATTKGGADVKVGDKVTVYYSMTANTIESKPAKPAKADKPAAAVPVPAMKKADAAPAPVHP
jgi:hypothetical protein